MFAGITKDKELDIVLQTSEQLAKEEKLQKKREQQRLKELEEEKKKAERNALKMKSIVFSGMY